MKLLIMLLLIVGCAKDVNYEGEPVQISEAIFSDTLEVKRGKKVIKTFEYVNKNEKTKKTFVKTWQTEGHYSCRKCGYCYDYRGKNSGYKWNCNCSGERAETRQYSTNRIDKTIIYTSSRRKDFIFKYDPYNRTGYRTIKSGSCQ